MPQRHHRHQEHGVDRDDERGPMTIADPDHGMLAHTEREGIADAYEANDDDLGPEEAALHIERFPDDDWPDDRTDD